MKKPTRNQIATLGPKYTFSDMAADKFLKETDQKLEKYFCRDVEEIFELVEKGKVVKGLAPIENQLNGTVRETLDNLFFKKIHVVKEVNIPIHHQFVTLPKSAKKDIKTIMSHVQALNQCKKYIKKNFPRAVVEASSSTTAAVEKLLSSKDKSMAVIASIKAAENNGLKILAKNIEDSHDNHTRFLVIERGDFLIKKPLNPEQKNRTKTSITFYFSKNKPGSLFQVFEIFSKAKINLSKIESRPTQKSLGEYMFYLDFEADILSPQAQKVLKSVSKKVAKLKVLGSY